LNYIASLYTWRIFKTREFARFARKEGIADRARRDARSTGPSAASSMRTSVAAHQAAYRPAGTRPQRRLSHGYCLSGECRALFVMGFAKSELDNIEDDDLVRLKAFAKHVLSWSETQVKRLLDSREWRELT
jgi:hypothetical protein